MKAFCLFTHNYFAYTSKKRVQFPIVHRNKRLNGSPKEAEYIKEIQMNKMNTAMTSLSNPKVTIWNYAESIDYPSQGMMGAMNLYVAADIYDFQNIPNILKELNEAGFGKRVYIADHDQHGIGDGIWLEYSIHNAKYFTEV